MKPRSYYCRGAQDLKRLLDMPKSCTMIESDHKAVGRLHYLSGQHDSPELLTLLTNVLEMSTTSLRFLFLGVFWRNHKGSLTAPQNFVAAICTLSRLESLECSGTMTFADDDIEK